MLWRGDGCAFDQAAAVPDLLLAEARNSGLRVFAELDISRFPIDHPLVEAHPALFALRRSGRGSTPIDPRQPSPADGTAQARLGQSEADVLLGAIEVALLGLVDAGLRGFRFSGIDRMRPDLLERLLHTLKRREPGLVMIADVGGLPRAEAAARAALGFDCLVSSFGWWDLRSAWLIEETEALRGSTRLVAELGPGHLGGTILPRSAAAFLPRRRRQAG